MTAYIIRYFVTLIMKYGHGRVGMQPGHALAPSGSRASLTTMACQTSHKSNRVRAREGGEWCVGHSMQQNRTRHCQARPGEVSGAQHAAYRGTEFTCEACAWSRSACTADNTNCFSALAPLTPLMFLERAVLTCLSWATVICWMSSGSGRLVWLVDAAACAARSLIRLEVKCGRTWHSPGSVHFWMRHSPNCWSEWTCRRRLSSWRPRWPRRHRRRERPG